MDARTMNEIITHESGVRFKHVLAFEVSKAELVTKVLPSGVKTTIANTPANVRRLIEKERKANAKLDLGPLLVVCEATGTYDRHVLESAVKKDIACHRAHGSRMRAYAKYRGVRAKTDSIDTDLIADYGRDTPDLRLYQPPCEKQQQMRALVTRRADLMDALHAEKARVEHTTVDIVVKSIRRQIKSLEKDIAEIEAALEAFVADDEELHTKTTLMRSVVGVGFTSAASMLAFVPELGQIGRGTVAALVGVAPYDNASGERDGLRHIAGGRQEARNMLYMCAVVAIRHNPHLADMAQRIIAKGRPNKVAITAVMRKLIVILNAILRDGKPCKMLAAARQSKENPKRIRESA
jgi:transposase